MPWAIFLQGFGYRTRVLRPTADAAKTGSMKERLIITNGDDAVARMREAGIRGEILPWRDILHEGPVPPSLPS